MYNYWVAGCNVLALPFMNFSSVTLDNLCTPFNATCLFLKSVDKLDDCCEGLIQLACSKLPDK